MRAAVLLGILMVGCASRAEGPLKQNASGRWVPIPLVNDSLRAKGVTGGEGAQWPRSLAVDSSGNRLIFGIDVGGIFRSEDGGSIWVPGNVGYSPRGAAAVAIDPGNSDRVIAIGGNTVPQRHHGPYLSTDGGKSWRNTLPIEMGGIDEWREQLAFDHTTFDKGARRTNVVYWSRVRNDKTTWGTPPQDPGIWRSTDGGETWTRMPNLDAYAGGILRVTGTRLVTGNADGLYVMGDRGRMAKVLEGPVTGVDTVPQRPGVIWVSQPTAVRVTEDFGRTWRNLNAPNAPQHSLQNLKVSPADPSRLILWRNQDPNTWDWKRFVSHDGGQTWTEVQNDWSRAFLPANSRQGIFVWHPKNKDVVWSIGGDFASKSTDGGRTFRMSNDGNNAILIGGHWNFNVFNPSLMFFGSQDYNAAFTTDAGKNWTYSNPSGNGWGGFCYGGYSINESTFIVGNSPGWGGPRTLRVSRDAGKTWTDTGLNYEGIDAAYGDPNNRNIAFAGSLRTTDGGATWRRMTNVHGVVTHGGNALYGIRRGDGQHAVVRSTDSGATWTVVGTASEEVKDVAFDANRNRVYAVIGDRAAFWSGSAWTFLNTPKSQFGGDHVKTIAVDPRNPDVVYVGSAGNILATSASVARSTDGGQTWQLLTLQSAPTGNQLDGGREALVIRVHPQTGEAWVSTSCYGIWKWVPG